MNLYFFAGILVGVGVTFAVAAAILFVLFRQDRD